MIPDHYAQPSKEEHARLFNAYLQSQIGKYNSFDEFLMETYYKCAK